MDAVTLADGTAHQSVLDAADIDSAGGIWSDGTTMWVTDRANITILAYTLADGARNADADITLDTTNTAPFGIWSDGATIWVADTDTGRLHTYPLPTARQ